MKMGGKMPANFLEPESRCDYYIDEKMKAVWKVLLDMLELVSAVCEKHKLRWWMSGGSLLGAIRHNGIIPWDDDIDIELPRKDYEMLLKVLPGELPPGLFLQTPANEFEYYITHAKLRNCNTSGVVIDYAKWHLHFNMGLFLDIFPLDGIPADQEVADRIMKRVGWMRGYRAARTRTKLYANTMRARIGQFCIKPILRLIGPRRMADMLSAPLREYDMYACEECQIAPGEWPYSNKKLGRRTEWYAQTKYVPFEYLQVPVPAEYDKILTRQFGDWHKFYRGGDYHGDQIQDASMPYKQLLKERFNYSDKELARM